MKALRRPDRAGCFASEGDVVVAVLMPGVAGESPVEVPPFDSGIVRPFIFG